MKQNTRTTLLAILGIALLTVFGLVTKKPKDKGYVICQQNDCDTIDNYTSSKDGTIVRYSIGDTDIIIYGSHSITPLK